MRFAFWALTYFLAKILSRWCSPGYSLSFDRFRDVWRTGALVCAKAGHNPSTPGASRTGCAAKGAEMPSYQNVTPPISLSSGDVGFSFNNEAFPGSATSGSQFALPSFTGVPDGGTAVRWQTIFGTNPTAVNIVLQGAMADVDAEYFLIDTSTAITGEARTVTGVQAKFLRIRFVSSTGGAGLTAKLMV